MKTGLLFRLGEYRGSASAAERNVIDYLLNNSSAAVGKSVHALADITYTSPSTVTRLCRKMGCEGYRGFQRMLVHDLALDRESHDLALEGIGAGEDIDQIIAKVSSKNIRSLEATQRLLDRDAVEACAGLIRVSRTVNLFGIGASLLVARDLELKLLRADESCNLSDDWHSQMLYAKNARPEDMAIVISYSGLTREMVACACTARQRGAKVVAITRADISTPLSEQADYVLGVAATELIVRSGAMSSRISQMNVVDILYAAYVSQNYERCRGLFRRNYIAKENGNSPV